MSKHVLDLRGVMCPMNFVKIKLKLEEVEVGAALAVLLDDGGAVENVPRSIRSEGHQIVSLVREDDYYRVLVKKGGE